MSTRKLALGAVLALAAANQVHAASCLESSTPGRLCSANDFTTISEELVSGPASCVEGEIIPGDVVVRIGLLGNRTSTYDIGFFIGDADSTPINGESCTFASLNRIEPVDGPFDRLSGSGPYRNLDGNACGDADKADDVIYKDITLGNVLCQDANNDGKLDVAYAVSYKQNAGACADPDNPDNFRLANASKCIDAVGDIDEITVQPPDPEVPSIRVQKLAEPNVISPGEDVDYSINVVNDGPVLVTLDSLVDDKFGDLNGQGSCALPQDIAPGQTYSCSFNATPAGSAPGFHLNVVTASGTANGLPVSDLDRARVSFTALDQGAIGYLVWNDLDADGIKEEDEPGIAGVTLELYAEREPDPVATTVTDETGAYEFTGLEGGIYEVLALESGPLSNLVRTTANNPVGVILAPGQVNTFANFGYVAAAIQVEKTADPIVVSAPGGMVDYHVEVLNTGPVAVELTGLVDDRFGDLLSQSACLTPAGPIEPGDFYSCSFSRDISGDPGDTHTNTVQAAARDLVNGYPVFGADDAIVGIEDPASASVGNLVWLDENANGVVDDGETGIDYVTLVLTFDSDNNGDYETTIATETTINSGEYEFVGLAAGNYRVTVTDDNQVLRDKFLTNPPEPLDVTLAPGQLLDDADFGYADIPKPKIRVVKVPSEFIVRSPSAEVDYNITVINTGDTVVTVDKLVDSRFGDLDGLGTCATGATVSQRQSYRCRFTRTISGEPLDIHRNRVTATASDAAGNIAFDSGPAGVLFIAPDSAAIGDQVWEDLDADGVFDDGEPGIGNVTIDLYRDGALVDSTATDASGKYAFSDLAAGSYQVRVSDTGGELDGLVLTGGAEPRDVELSTGQNFSDADFGYAAAAIEVVKTGDPVVLLEPGGSVNYTVTIRNIGYVDVTLTSLQDDRFGDLNGQGSCSVPLAVPARSSVACQFSAAVSGAAGESHTNVVTATAADSAGNEVFAEASFSVRFIAIDFGAGGFLVWNDENANGVRESSEPGIANVTLDLELDEDNDGVFERLAASAVTNGEGYYVFFPVPAGNWRIRVTDSYGVLQGKVITGGTNPNRFTLAGGQVYRDANFGYFRDESEPPIEPPIDPPEPPAATAIPVNPAWLLALSILGTLGLGLVALRRSAR